MFPPKGAQYQSSRWDQHFGVFRSSPGDGHQQPQAAPPHPHPHQQQPFDREALTAELVKFSRSLRYGPGRDGAGGDHLMGGNNIVFVNFCIYSLIQLAISRSSRPLFACSLLSASASRFRPPPSAPPLASARSGAASRGPAGPLRICPAAVLPLMLMPTPPTRTRTPPTTTTTIPPSQPP